MKTTKLQLKYRALSDLAAWPRNPKLHDLDTIQSSIRRFGFNDPIAVDEASQQLVEGHGRLESLQLMKETGEDPPARVRLRKKDGEWLVPTLAGLSFENDAEAEAYIIGHNRATESGGWVEEALSEMFKRFQDVEDDELFEAIGYSREEVDEIVMLADYNAQQTAADIPDAEAPDETYIRQLMLGFDEERYGVVVRQLQAYALANDAGSNTEAVIGLLT